jgi:hypothetical protein
VKEENWSLPEILMSKKYPVWLKVVDFILVMTPFFVGLGLSIACGDCLPAIFGFAMSWVPFCGGL